jgi:ATPase family AAA domain-containing protein 3A/B
LGQSKHAKEAIDIIKLQEVTRQKELEATRAQYLQQREQLAIQRVHEEEEAAGRTLEKQTQHDKAKAEYRDQLERKRIIEQINTQRKLAEEEREKNEESLRRQEEIRRKTLEYEAELRQRTEIARVNAEYVGKIRQERENHDLVIDKRRIELKEYRDTVLESIKEASSNIGRGLQDYLSDEKKLTNSVAALTVLAFGVYSARTSISVLGRFIESRLGKPTLVRETSRMNALQFIRSPLQAIRQASIQIYRPNQVEDALRGIVLPTTIDCRLRQIASTTVNTKANRAPYRNLLLYGPPGTGKTMFAKGLAKDSGMHYAIMTGGDIAPLGKDAVTEIHKLFDWANQTNRGVIIFVDEADAFLRKRSTQQISEDMRNALNAFLYRTGEASKKVMLIYASNQPEQIDWAVNDRIDELIEIGLPKLDERQRMLNLYIDSYLRNNASSMFTASRKITLAIDIDDDFVSKIAKETSGFSGREISKLAIGWQAAAYGSKDAIIDASMMKEVLGNMKKSKKQKQAWLTMAEIEKLTSEDESLPPK